MFGHLLAILKLFLSVYLRVCLCVEKLTFRKVTLTFDLDIWRQSIIDADSFLKGIFFLMGPMFCLGQPILIKFGRLVPFGLWTNSLEGFWKIRKIA